MLLFIRHDIVHVAGPTYRRGNYVTAECKSSYWHSFPALNLSVTVKNGDLSEVSCQECIENNKEADDDRISNGSYTEPA